MISTRTVRPAARFPLSPMKAKHLVSCAVPGQQLSHLPLCTFCCKRRASCRDHNLLTMSSRWPRDEAPQNRNEHRERNCWCSAGRRARSLLLQHFILSFGRPLNRHRSKWKRCRSHWRGRRPRRKTLLISRKSVHTVPVTRPAPEQPTPAPPATRVATNPPGPATLPSHAEPVDVCARNGGRRVDFMRGHHAMWRCVYPRRR